MNDINQLFFELIRVAIGNAVCLSHTPTAKEWQMLYEMAKKQSLVGICFAGVQKLHAQRQAPNSWGSPEGEMLYLQWMGMAAKIQQRNEVLNRQCAELQAKLSDCGLRSAVLKGQGVASLYSEPLSGLRQSGDIDVFVEDGMDKVLDWCKGKYGDVEFDYINAHVPVFKDTEVELHWRAQAMTDLFVNKRLQRWVAAHEDMILGDKSVLPNGGEIVVPTAEFNAFYVLLHAYTHLLGEGLGLRQLMDYYFVLLSLERELPQIDRKLSVNALLKEFGMEKFARGVMWIMKTVFVGHDNDDDNFYLGIKPDEKAGRFILNEVMMGGNFGHHDERKVRLSDNGRWQSVWSQLQHAVRMARFAPMNVFWQPVWVVYHFIWKRTAARKWL